MSKANQWFQSRVEYTGKATVILTATREELTGDATVWFTDDGRSDISFDCTNVGTIDLLRQMNHSLRAPVTFEVICSNGVFSSQDAIVSGMTIGHSRNYRISARHATFQAEAGGTPHYWVLPLINCLLDDFEHSQAVQDHPLRVRSKGWQSIPFEFAGRPAFIQSLPTRSKRQESLDAGTSKQEATSLMIGEIGNGPANNWWEAALWHGLLPVIGIATGTNVGAPWIELRDSNGALIERHHLHWTPRAFTRGHKAIYDTSGPCVKELLRCCQQSGIFGKAEWLPLFSHTIKAGWLANSFELWGYHSCVVLDDLCRRHNVTSQDLSTMLTPQTRSDIEAIILDASNRVQAQYRSKKGAGEHDEAQVLQAIKGRLENVHRKDRNFGLAIGMLLALPDFGLNDGQVMSGYSGFKSFQGDWAAALAVCRNALMHEGSVDSIGLDLQNDLVPLFNHLHDIVLRLMFRLLGYSGTYSSPLHLDLLKVDWVSTTLKPAELGYP